jgi:hypothetical protein
LKVLDCTYKRLNFILVSISFFNCYNSLVSQLAVVRKKEKTIVFLQLMDSHAKGNDTNNSNNRDKGDSNVGERDLESTTSTGKNFCTYKRLADAKLESSQSEKFKIIRYNLYVGQKQYCQFKATLFKMSSNINGINVMEMHFKEEPKADLRAFSDVLVSLDSGIMEGCLIIVSFGVLDPQTGSYVRIVKNTIIQNRTGLSLEDYYIYENILASKIKHEKKVMVNTYLYNVVRGLPVIRCIYSVDPSTNDTFFRQIG